MVLWFTRSEYGRSFDATINAPAIEANVNAIAAGHSAPFIVNKPFFDSFVNLEEQVQL